MRKILTFFQLVISTIKYLTKVTKINYVVNFDYPAPAIYQVIINQAAVSGRLWNNLPSSLYCLRMSVINCFEPTVGFTNDKQLQDLSLENSVLNVFSQIS